MSSVQRVTRKFASPTTNQPFSSNVQAQLQRAVVHKNLLLHASRYWVTHSQAVRLCGTRPKKGSESTQVKLYSETVVPFESIEASQRKALLSTTPPYFGLGVGIFVEGRWKQINRPPSVVAQLNPTMADRRLYIDTNTAIDLGLLAGKTPKNAVAIKTDARLRLFHASQLEDPERCVPPEGLAVNPSTGRRWTQPAHDVLVAAGVLMGYVSPMWLTSKQAERHYGVQILNEANTVTTHLREGTAVQWKELPPSVKAALRGQIGGPPDVHAVSLMDLGQWERIDHPRVANALAATRLWATKEQVETVVPGLVKWHKIPASATVSLSQRTKETFVNAENTNDPRIIQPRDRAFVLVSGRFVSQAFTDELLKIAARREYVSPLWFTRSDLARMGVSIRSGEKPVVLSSSSTPTEEFLYNAEDIVEFDDMVAENPPARDAGHQVFLVNWRPVAAPGKIAALNALGRTYPLWISETELTVSGYSVKPGAKRYKLLGGICGRRPTEKDTERVIVGRQVFNAEQSTDPVRATACTHFLVRNKSL